MRLPRELRDEIYHYALLAESQDESARFLKLRPFSGLENELENAWYPRTLWSQSLYYFINNRRPDPIFQCTYKDFKQNPGSFYLPGNFDIIPAAVFQDMVCFWSCKALTRLFCISHTVRREARELMYSRITISWPYWTDKDFVRACLYPIPQQTLAMIKTVILNPEFWAIGEKGTSQSKNHSNVSKLQWKNAIGWLVGSLPALSKVQLHVGVRFPEWCEDQRVNVQNTINLALDIISPLQELDLMVLDIKPGVNLEKPKLSKEESTVVEIVKGMCELVGTGIW